MICNAHRQLAMLEYVIPPQGLAVGAAGELVRAESPEVPAIVRPTTHR